ncbi:hypothetical protein, partial [Aeromonas veronii]|uniref:hypothetical protein n=1 Tax=Aeromonas veronii TaxID=654 RepID=UPI002B482F4D
FKWGDVKKFENNSVWWKFSQSGWFYSHRPPTYCLYANPMPNPSHQIDNSQNPHLCRQYLSWSYAT